MLPQKICSIIQPRGSSYRNRSRALRLMRMSTAAPKGYYFASEGLDQKARVSILAKENDLNRGDINGYVGARKIPSEEQRLLESFQEAIKSEASGNLKPGTKEEKEYQLQKGLARSAYLRALIRLPTVIVPCTEEIQNEKRFPNPFIATSLKTKEGNERNVFPIFTSMDKYESFIRQVGPSASAVKPITCNGDQLGGFLHVASQKSEWHLAVDAANTQLEGNIGFFPQTEFAWYGVQQTSVMFINAIARDGVANEVVRRVHVVALGDEKNFFVSGLAPDQMYMNLFISIPHREVALYYTKEIRAHKTFQPVAILFNEVISNLRFGPPIVGFSTDRVAINEWSIFAGLDYPHERRDVNIVQKNPPQQPLPADGLKLNK